MQKIRWEGLTSEPDNKKDNKAGEMHDGGVLDFFEQTVDGLKKNKGELEEDRDY